MKIFQNYSLKVIEILWIVSNVKIPFVAKKNTAHLLLSLSLNNVLLFGCFTVDKPMAK